ncbi:hypothetical protein PoHVEF18_007036 [Penicillium ochrochloron]
MARKLPTRTRLIEALESGVQWAKRESNLAEAEVDALAAQIEDVDNAVNNNKDLSTKAISTLMLEEVKKIFNIALAPKRDAKQRDHWNITPFPYTDLPNPQEFLEILATLDKELKRLESAYEGSTMNEAMVRSRLDLILLQTLGWAKEGPTQPQGADQAQSEVQSTTQGDDQDQGGARKRRRRGTAKLLDSYHPADPEYAEIGETATIPRAVVGTQNQQPGAWAKLLWQTPWKKAAKGKKLKGNLLPELIKMSPKRELMAREGFFRSGKHEKERISDQLANIESAFIQCIGAVQEERCDSWVKHHGPWAKCVRLRDGQGDALACANCRWNGKFRVCSLWQQEQTPETLAALKSGPKPAVNDEIREAIMGIAQCRGQMQEVAHTLKETVADPLNVLGLPRPR